MKKSKWRIHWLIWPILGLAVAGLILPLLWPGGPAAALLGQQGLPFAWAKNQATPSATQPVEQPVTGIPMTGRLADPSAEISGLAWYGDYLILLPQYPRHVTGGNAGYIYALRKSELLDYLDGKSDKPLEPISIQFDAYGIRDQMRNFQGFESIGFLGERVYVTIEAGSGTQMMGYLASGTVEPDMSRIVLDKSRLTPIEPQTDLGNKADEALLVLDDRILTFYEVNGATFNPKPVVHVFNLDLQPINTQPMAPLEYRVTDAARIPGTNQFWVINSFFLGDLELLPKSDPLAEAFGKGPTHSRFPMVERLVRLQYDPTTGVSLTGTAPVQLELASIADTRNWEGLALLDDRGFLMATDKYPGTILGFVAFP